MNIRSRVRNVNAGSSNFGKYGRVTGWFKPPFPNQPTLNCVMYDDGTQSDTADHLLERVAEEAA